jgi:hypothetical protein
MRSSTDVASAPAAIAAALSRGPVSSTSFRDTVKNLYTEYRHMHNKDEHPVGREIHAHPGGREIHALTALASRERGRISFGYNQTVIYHTIFSKKFESLTIFILSSRDLISCTLAIQNFEQGIVYTYYNVCTMLLGHAIRL